MIEFERVEYEKMLPVWDKIQRVADGRDVTDYIWRLNPSDNSYEMRVRNEEFANRAVFYSITSYTIRGFLGLVYDTPPRVELPEGIDYLLDNIDGTGVGLIQQAQEVTNQTIRVGRCGLWVDFPTTDGGDISKAEMVNMFATVQLFEARDIYYWSTRRIGAEVVLDDIRIFTSRTVKDGYKLKTEKLIMQLYLDESLNYAIQYFIQNKDKEWVPDGGAIYPRDGRGNTWDRIPFVFVGSETNSHNLDQPPMEGIVELNVAHYNDSAIYQDSVLTVGQPQPWCSGYSISDLEELSQSNFYIGSRRLLSVPPGERFGFEQAKENPLAREAMRDKIEMMIGIGAMFIQPGGAQKTATQIDAESRTQNSVLALIASNTSEAYNQVLEMVQKYMNVEGEAEMTVNTNYVKSDADPNMLREMIAGFLSGAIPASDYHAFMVRTELTSEDKDRDEFIGELASVGAIELDE